MGSGILNHFRLTNLQIFYTIFGEKCQYEHPVLMFYTVKRKLIYSSRNRFKRAVPFETNALQYLQ